MADTTKEFTKSELEGKTKVNLINVILQLQKDNQRLSSNIKLLEKKLIAKRAETVVTEGTSVTTLQFGNLYPLTESWINKIRFVLKQVNRPMRSEEIIAVLINNDRLFRTFRNKGKYLSTYLTRAKDSGRIIVLQRPGEKSKWYELP